MNKEELTAELLDFLDSKGIYVDFLEWEKDRGYTEDEVEKIIEQSRDF